jgi:hypothetical protein
MDVSVMTGLAQEISELATDLAAKRQSVDTYKKLMGEFRSEVELSVAFAVNPDGKKKYSNETERRAATEATCKQDPKYSLGTQEIENLEPQITSLEIKLELKRNLLKIERLNFMSNAGIKE